MNKDILICGVGGQGTVLASKIIAASAMEEGHPVHSAETIGMAQRGGSVTSHVRIGADAFAPMIPFGSASLLLAFEPGEAVRNLQQRLIERKKSWLRWGRRQMKNLLPMPNRCGQSWIKKRRLSVLKPEQSLKQQRRSWRKGS